MRKSPFNGKATVHEGVDLAAPKGSVIVAPGAGSVRAVPNHKQFGNVVFIDHGFGVTTVFAHLSRIDVKTGDKVHRGQILGLIGTSGHSTGPHLHYEVHVDGQAVDPTPYLSVDFGQLAALTPLPNT